jgi:hypothetical protein
VPTQYNGLPANISRPVATNIASSTNANPSTVTTAAAHNLTTGDTVVIANHAVNTALNGQWAATVLTPTSFSVPAPSNGVGVMTGTVQGQGLLPTFAEQSDGDVWNAAATNVGLSALGDRAEYIAQRVSNTHKVIAYVFQGPADNAEPAGTTTTWVTNAYSGAFNVATLNTQLIAGDIVVWRCQLGIQLPAATETVWIKAQRSVDSGDTKVDTAVVSRVQLAGVAANNLLVSAVLNGSETIPTNTVALRYKLWLLGRNTNNAVVLSLLNNSTYELNALRPTT